MTTRRTHLWARLAAIVLSLVIVVSASTAVSAHAMLSAPVPGYYPVSRLHQPAGHNTTGMDLDPETGLVWVTEAFRHVLAIDHAGVVQETISGTDLEGYGLAISDGLVFATTLDNDVQVWTTSGVFVRTIGEGSFDSACAIEVVGNNVYIGDRTAGGVWIYSITGTYVGFFDEAAAGTPLVLSCLGDFITSDGSELFVWDPGNDQISVFDLSGIHQRDLSIVGGHGVLDIDGSGDLWLADGANHRLSKFDSNGALLGVFDTPGFLLGQIDFPEGLVVDPSGDSFWIDNEDSSSVHVWTTLTCNGENVTQVGTSYPDNFSGDGADVVALGNGNDRYSAGDSDDTVCGGPGDDTIRGGPGADLLIGQSGDDTIIGGGGADEIFGSSGDDNLDGQGGADEIYGSSGDDTINGRGAPDFIIGGIDRDTINGQNGADNIDGAAGDDDIFGQTGPDTLYGELGDDNLFGGGGSDILHGGNGLDKCAGNTGIDQAEAATCEQTPGIEILF